jgi:hypothetical protein
MSADQLELFGPTKLSRPPLPVGMLPLDFVDDFLDAWAQDRGVVRLYRLCRERGIEVAGYL